MPGTDENPDQSAHGAPIILLYHRVDCPPTDAQWLCVSPRHFDEHLSVLRRISYPMSLRELANRLTAGERLPDRAVVLTFDDGYADNLESAYPLLARYAVPATVFVTASSEATPEPFWWDMAEQIHLADSARASPGWNVLQLDRAGSTERAYLSCCERMRTMDDASRRMELQRMTEAGGVCTAVAAPARLTVEQVVELAADGLVDIGAHTVTHPVLARLDPEDQREEITGSKRLLEEWLGRPVANFSYPYGTRRDYTDQTVEIVRRAGFQIACANRPGRIEATIDRFQLPRFVVRDWDGDQFERQLAAWRSGSNS